MGSKKPEDPFRIIRQLREVGLHPFTPVLATNTPTRPHQNAFTWRRLSAIVKRVAKAPARREC